MGIMWPMGVMSVPLALDTALAEEYWVDGDLLNRAISKAWRIDAITL